MSPIIDGVWAEFQAEVANHYVKLKHREGLYSHYVVQRTGTRLWSWEIVTWPGTLAIRGDAFGDWIFADKHRDDVMRVVASSAEREKSGMPKLNFGYEAELLGDPLRAYKYYPSVFLAEIRRFLSAQTTEMVGVREREALLADAEFHCETEAEAREWADAQLSRLDPEFHNEAGFTDFDGDFLRACFAIHKTRQMGGQAR